MRSITLFGGMVIIGSWFIPQATAQQTAAPHVAAQHAGTHAGTNVGAQGRAPSTGTLNPVGGSGNVWTPGIPRSTAAGSPIRAGGVAGGRPRGVVGRNGGYYGGGAVLVPYPLAGAGAYSLYTPAPGEYDSGYDPATQPTPTVIINQNFQPEVVRPQVRDYSNAFPPSGPQTAVQTYETAPAQPVGTTIDGDTPLILIAMKDHTIYPAIAYWVQGDTLNYVMAGGAVNHASITAVDRALTAQLNAERKVEFHLPAEK